MLFRLEWVYFWKIVGVFPGKLLKLQSSCQFEESAEKIYDFFNITFAHRENYFVSFSKFLRRGCQKLNSFCREEPFFGTFFRRTCVFIQLRIWQKFFSLSLLSRFFSRGSLNWNLHFLRNISKEKAFLR